MALFHCMVQHGMVRYGSLLGGFPLGPVPGTRYFFSTTSAKVPSDSYRYQNVTCKLCWSPIGRRKSSLLHHWTCDTRPNLCNIYGRSVLKWIMQHDLLTHAHYLTPKKYVLKQAVICTAFSRLRWSLWKWDVALVFFNVRLVSKSHAEFSPPIGAFMELHSKDNLPCLVNLALSV